MTKYTILIVDKVDGVDVNTVGTVEANNVSPGDMVEVELHDENGMLITHSGIAQSILEEEQA